MEIKSQPPKITETQSIYPQVRFLAQEVWKLLSAICNWINRDYYTKVETRAAIREIIRDDLKTKVALFAEAVEPQTVPGGYVAIFMDSSDGNVPKMKDSSGIKYRITFQDNENTET